MKKVSLLGILLACFMSAGACSDDHEPQVVTDRVVVEIPENAYVLAEQSRRAIVIRDADTQQNIWSWDPYTAQVPAGHQSWFVNPSEVKPVYNRRYILMTASGGAVALIRIADHKLMFYGYCGNNPHSAEILPDGNIVTAESKLGEINTFVVDTAKVFGVKANTIILGNAHNVVWDKYKKCLYASATIQSGVTALFKLNYNGQRSNPKLYNQKRIFTFPDERGGHDLFPVYGETNKLWFTAASAVYQFDLSTDKPTCQKIYTLSDIKSVCNGPQGVIMLQPTEEWWAEGLINESGEKLFRMQDARIYKGRWMLDNTFSYPEQHDLEYPEGGAN